MTTSPIWIRELKDLCDFFQGLTNITWPTGMLTPVLCDSKWNSIPRMPHCLFYAMLSPLYSWRSVKENRQQQRKFHEAILHELFFIKAAGI